MAEISEETDINKTNASKEGDICNHWYFSDKYFKYKPYLSIGSHDLMQKSVNFNDIAIVFVKGSDYRIHFLIYEEKRLIKQRLTKNYLMSFFE